MPRRNLLILVFMLAASHLCQARARNGRYATILADAMGEIRQKYIADVPPRRLFEGAMRGMVDGLGDRYSNFLGEKEYQALREENLDKEFEGIGVHLDTQAKQLTVLAPIFGGPAERAGVRAGDRILKVDGKSIEGFSHQAAIDLIKGPEGTSVTLTILHEEAAQAVDITIRRSMVSVESVVGFQRQLDGSWRYSVDVAPQLAYVRLTSFSARTVEELQVALAAIQAHRQYRGLILDLRDNSGGLLEAAVKACDLFVPDGKTIVTIRDRFDQIRRSFTAGDGMKFDRMPLVVLINKESASASEIVAACLQDHGIAVVIGAQSFGKGTVQDLVQLEGGRSVLKLTTATYRRPSGLNIHRTDDNQADREAWGVRPTAGYEVKLTDAQIDAVRAAFRRRDRTEAKAPAANGTSKSDKPDPSKPAAKSPAKTSVQIDPQLAKAVEYLQSQGTN